MTSSFEPLPIPQLPTRPLVGNVPDVDGRAPAQSLTRLVEELGPIYRLRFPGLSFAVVGSHALAADACDPARFEKFVHRPLQHIRDFAGDGLFTAHNDEPNWGKAHRLLTPAFSPAAMRNYFEDMLDIADQMLTKWERLGPDAELDVADNMTRLTLDTIALSGFAYRFNSFYQREMHPFVEAMVRALHEAGQRGRRLPLQNMLMRRTQKRYRADGAYMHAVTQELIAARRALPREEAPRDLLGLMLEAADPVTGERLDDENIRYQLVTFLIAGHETTSGLLSFAVHELLGNPAVLERARRTVDEVLGGEAPRYEHVARLDYLDWILRETLRLHPTAPAFAVVAKEDTTLAGRYAAAKGDRFMILLPALHRDPAVWPEPARFDPERFAPGRRDAIPPHAWMPFGNGQRSCIGRAFAMQEATLVLAMLLQRFEIAPAGPYELAVKETLTMKPEGLRIKVRRRKAPPTPHAAEGAARPARPEGPGPRAPEGGGLPLLVLYGSNTGSSEAFARRIAAEGEARGYRPSVRTLDEAVGRLPTEGAVVLVTASYNGLAPRNARAFAAWLKELTPGSLAGVRYAVFGCGNRDWPKTYQAIPQAFERALAEAGATAFHARGEADARADFFGDFEAWYAGFWPALEAVRGQAPLPQACPFARPAAPEAPACPHAPSPR